MELYTNNRQDGRLVQISHRSTKEEIFSLTLTVNDPKICVFVTDFFLWFIMLHHGSEFGLIWEDLLTIFPTKIISSAQLSTESTESDPESCLDTPHARPRAVLDFTKTYGTFLSSQTKGLSFTKCVDAWLQVGSVLLFFGDG